MKFTNGYWQLRQGVTAFHPSQAYDIESAPDWLTIYAVTGWIVWLSAA
jgi:hypothetical protein